MTHILNQLASNRNGFPTEMDSLIMSRFLDQMLFDQQVFKPRVIVEEAGRTYFLPPLSVFLAAAFNKPVFVSLEAPAGDAFGFRALRSLVTVQAVATTCPAVAKVSSATLAAESPNLSPKIQITLNFLISKPAPPRTTVNLNHKKVTTLIVQVLTNWVVNTNRNRPPAGFRIHIAVL
jgi:hypothetical protein